MGWVAMDPSAQGCRAGDAGDVGHVVWCLEWALTPPTPAHAGVQ